MVNWQDFPSVLTPLTAANLAAAFAEKVAVTSVGAAGGVATLDGAGDVPLAQIPDLSASYATVAVAAGKAPLSLTGIYASRPAATAVPSGTVYYCTNIAEQYRSDGTTWTVVGSGGNELGYAQIVTPFSTTSTTPVPVTGLTSTFVVGERPISLRFTGWMRNVTSGAYCWGYITLDGTVVRKCGGAYSTYWTADAAVRISGLTPGSTHTLTMQLAAPLALGTSTIECDSAAPAAIQAVTV